MVTIMLARCADLCTIATMMMTDDQIASLIRDLATARGWSESYAARRATGSGDTLDRIERGVSLTMRRANRVMVNIARLWPDDQPMPQSIAAIHLTGRAA